MIKSNSSGLELWGVSFLRYMPSAWRSRSTLLWYLIRATSCISVNLHQCPLSQQVHKRPRVGPSHSFYWFGLHPWSLWRRRLLTLEHHQRVLGERERVEEGGKLEDISWHETRENLYHTIMCAMMLFCCTLKLVTDWPLTKRKTCCFDLIFHTGILEIRLLNYLNIMKDVAVVTLFSFLHVLNLLDEIRTGKIMRTQEFFIL